MVLMADLRRQLHQDSVYFCRPGGLLLDKRKMRDISGKRDLEIGLNFRTFAAIFA